MVALSALSCSEEIVVIDSYVDVEISTAIEPDYMDEWYGRAESISDVDGDVYDMRYTIELWSGDGSQVYYRAEKILSDISQDLTHSMRAIAGDYKLVIFADYVVTEDGVVSQSHYTTANNLDEITIINSSYTANDASRDCYGYSQELIITSSFSLSNIVLNRVMAKMTLSDSYPADITADSEVSVSYGGDTTPPSGYNLLNGTVIMDSAITPTYLTTQVHQTIAFDYIFISEPTSYLMTFKVGDKEVGATVNFEQNKITNIIANFFKTNTE